MLARLGLKIGETINFRQTSLLQDVMMEYIGVYADFLHNGNLNLYSQHVKTDSDENYWWIIQTLNKDAYENIRPIWKPRIDVGNCKFPR